MKAVGVGCIFFRHDTENGLCDEFDLVKFKKDIISQLKKIENISNVTAKYISDNSVGFRSFEEDEDDKVIPVPISFEISFSIFLPFHIQKQYQGQADVESFCVRIVYGYERPVVYCSYEWDGEVGGCSPSSAVVILRKYLRQRMSGSPIVCEFIGPSPFHADFYIRQSDIETRGDLTKTVSSGYDQFEFVYNAHNSTEDGLTMFINAYNDTFSAFYYLETLSIKLYRYRQGVLNSCTELLDEDEEVSWIRRKLHSIRRHNKINSINRDTLRERICHAQMTDFIASITREGRPSIFTTLKLYFDEFSDQMKAMSANDFKGIVDIFESRRQGLWNNVSILVAGLLGGVLGAIIATLMAWSYPGAPRATEDSGATALERRVPDQQKMVPSNSSLSAPAVR